MPCDLIDTFQRVCCISLDRTPGRWKRFLDRVPDDWPFRAIDRVSAVDGKRCPAPSWWRAGNPAWGCYRSHLRLIEECLRDGTESILLLEDDAVFCDDFAARVKTFIDALPNHWGMIYLGGQHLKVNSHPPKRINDQVYRPWNVNRTHAFGLRGRTMMRTVYQHLCATDGWRGAQHVDHHLGRLHQRRKDPIFCPPEWLVGQAEGRSTISGKTPPERFWAPAQSLAIDVSQENFVAVVGLHSSGSSCLAGVLHHLGLHLGNSLGGYWGKTTEVGRGGYEAAGLAQICEAAVPFPAVEYSQRRGQIWHALRKWIESRRREAKQRGTIAAGKYPQLCRLGDQLRNLCGPQLRVISCERPIEESIASIVRRCPKHDAAKLAEHQRWLDRGRRSLLEQVLPEQQLSVNYHELLTQPAIQIQRLVDWLGIAPTPEQLEAAAGHVDAGQRHVALSQDNQPQRA